MNSNLTTARERRHYIFKWRLYTKKVIELEER
jgi:hypothetical protein